MFVDDRLTNPDNDTRYFMERVNLSPVIAELQQIEIDDMAYAKGAIYKELANILDEKSVVKIDREVIAILNRFKEYSFFMFPDALYNKYSSEDTTNEDCIKYLVENASDEDKANAKAIMLEQWRNDCNARSENFQAHLNGDGILSDDILIKATSILHSKIIQFAIMLDCILLENHHDLIQMQEQYGIKLIDCHSKAHLTEYTGMKGYANKLFNGIKNADDETDKPITLPEEIDTPRVRKYFKRAMEVGYITQSDKGFKWMDDKRGELAMLGYFIQRAFCPNNVEKIPEKTINALFNVSRIGSAITQLNSAKNPQPWRKVIDNSIFYD